MSTEDQLHVAIDDDPAEGTRRLILADWLDEFARDESDRMKAVGYRAMAAAGVYPFKHTVIWTWEKLPAWRFLNSAQTAATEQHAVITEELIGGMKDGYDFGVGYSGYNRRALEDRWAEAIGKFLTRPGATA